MSMTILELVKPRPDWLGALQIALTRPPGVPERRSGEDPWSRPRRSARAASPTISPGSATPWTSPTRTGCARSTTPRPSRRGSRPTRRSSRVRAARPARRLGRRRLPPARARRGRAGAVAPATSARPPRAGPAGRPRRSRGPRSARRRGRARPSRSAAGRRRSWRSTTVAPRVHSPLVSMATNVSTQRMSVGSIASATAQASWTGGPPKPQRSSSRAEERDPADDRARDVAVERAQALDDRRRRQRLVGEVEPDHRHRHAAREHPLRGLRVDPDVELGGRGAVPGRSSRP